jgi:hypothetical protein
MHADSRKQQQGALPNRLSPSSAKGRFGGEPAAACVGPPAPSPPASFGAMESGGEPSSSAGGLCIGVDLGLLASIPRQHLLRCCLGLRYSGTSPAAVTALSSVRRCPLALAVGGVA